MASIKLDFPTKNIRSIIWQIGYCIGGNFNIHIWAWSASPYDICSSEEIIENANSVSVDSYHIFSVRNQLPVHCPIQQILISFLFSNGKPVS